MIGIESHLGRYTSDESSTTQLPNFTINHGAKALRRVDGSNAAAPETKDPSLSRVNPEVQDEPVDEACVDETNLTDENEPVQNDIPACPARAASPVVEMENLTSEPPLEAAHDEVTIIGEVRKTPETSNVLAKVTTKKDSPMVEKGKAKLELPSLESLDVGSLHQAFFTWLSESRETEAAMVDTLKRKYEEILDYAESSAVGLQKDLNKEKKLRKEAESLSADLHRSLLQAADTLQDTKANFEKEIAALMKRAKDAEAKLELVKQELATLKGQIKDMCVAVFGRKDHNIVELPLVKLKAIYKFLEQLYVGGSYCIMAVKNTKAPPHYIMGMLKELSIVPEWIEELKRTDCRQGALHALTRGKAYFPELVPAQLDDGFPEFKLDRTPFGNEEYLRCMMENRVAMTQIAEENDLTKFQAAYSEAGKRLSPPMPQPFELNPPCKQHFAPGVQIASVMRKDSVF